MEEPKPALTSLSARDVVAALALAGLLAAGEKQRNSHCPNPIGNVVGAAVDAADALIARLGYDAGRVEW